MPLELSPSEGFYDEYIRDGWFTEKEALWPGQRMSIEIDEILEVGKSLFQDILVFKSKTYGIVLVLDGVIQVTERDEFSYQEMIAHLPLFAHPNPKKVLIVGGGDGGVLREVAKHACVETIHMCEIDVAVVEAGKKYFPTTLATSFNDPRLTLMINDACAFLKNEGAGQDYDVIICDSSDPVGPAEMLFEAEFFRNMKAALNPAHGVLCTQAECIWLHMDIIGQVMERTRAIMPVCEYGYTTIPTYPSGQIGFMIASNRPDMPVNVPCRPAPADMPLRYYSTRLHPCAFVLPAFADKAINSKK